MEFDKRQVDLVTVRTPLISRYRKFFRSLSKIARVQLITGTFVPTFDLGMNMSTILAYTRLLVRSLIKSRPMIMDINASVYTLLRSNKDLEVVDFRTPYPLELAWLGHDNLASLAKRMEKTVQDRLVFAANERMASLCKELGATSVRVVPNYPTRDFKSTVEPKKWKSTHGLLSDGHVALFTGSNTGWKIKSIYGLDLLLQGWKLVERSVDADDVDLVIVGGAPVDYVYSKMQSLGVRHLVLPGKVSSGDVANWIGCADVCLAPRTPSFPKHFYDDKDSTKISEYAALEKPIVAAGYAPSSQYLLVDQTPEALAEGIVKGLNGRITPSKPHYWEENEPLMLSLLEDFWFG